MGKQAVAVNEAVFTAGQQVRDNYLDFISAELRQLGSRRELQRTPDCGIIIYVSGDESLCNSRVFLTGHKT